MLLSVPQCPILLNMEGKLQEILINLFRLLYYKIFVCVLQHLDVSEVFTLVWKVY